MNTQTQTWTQAHLRRACLQPSMMIDMCNVVWGLPNPSRWLWRPDSQRRTFLPAVRETPSVLGQKLGVWWDRNTSCALPVPVPMTGVCWEFSSWFEAMSWIPVTRVTRSRQAGPVQKVKATFCCCFKNMPSALQSDLRQMEKCPPNSFVTQAIWTSQRTEHGMNATRQELHHSSTFFCISQLFSSQSSRSLFSSLPPWHLGATLIVSISLEHHQGDLLWLSWLRRVLAFSQVAVGDLCEYAVDQSIRLQELPEHVRCRLKSLACTIWDQWWSVSVLTIQLYDTFLACEGFTAPNPEWLK